MRKQSKRILAVLLAVLLLLSAAACAKTPASSAAPTESKTESTGSTEEKSYYNKEGLPICDDVITITVSGRNTAQDDWNQSVLVKEIEKRMGIKWDCNPYGSDAWANQFALMLSNDSLPDLLVSAGMVTKSQLDKYGEEGFILNLNDYMDLMPNLAAMDTEMPTYLRYYRSANGNLYCLGQATDNIITRALVGYSWLPKKWLQNVGMEVPNTLEELHQVLVAFRDQDANGNGKTDDEIPMSFTIGRECGQRMEWAMKFAFGLYSQAADYQLFIDDDGKANIYETTDNYRKYLSFLNQLWTEGLMDSETFTQTSAQYRDKIRTDRIGYGGDWAGLASSLDKRGEPVWCNGDYEMIMTFESEVDKGRFFAVGDGLGPLDYFVSAKTKYPEAICRMTDYWYTDDGKILLMKGVEGETFEYLPEDEFGVKAISVAGYDKKSIGVNVLWTNIPGNEAKAVLKADDATLEKMKNNPTYADNALQLSLLNEATIVKTFPTVSYTEEEGKEHTSLSTDITLYIKQMHTEFINGETSLTDENWAAFQNKLVEMGLPRLLEIEQAAYDRLNK